MIEDSLLIFSYASLGQGGCCFFCRSLRAVKAHQGLEHPCLRSTCSAGGRYLCHHGSSVGWTALGAELHLTPSPLVTPEKSWHAPRHSTCDGKRCCSQTWSSLRRLWRVAVRLEWLRTVAPTLLMTRYLISRK